jgi:hypothetical protein
LRPERSRSFAPFPGARVSIRPWRFISRPDGVATLTNVYEAAFEADRCSFGVHHASRPLPLAAMPVGTGPAILMNAGFLLVADEPFEAANPAYHLQIRGGWPIGLHSNGRTALVEHAGRLRPLFVPARGWLAVGSERLDWVGCREPDPPPDVALAFGPQDQGLVRDNSGIRLDRSRAAAPARQGRLNVAFCCRDGRPEVAAITDQAVPILGAAFIIQTPAATAAKLRVGDPVVDWRIGQLAPDNASGAVTVSVELLVDQDRMLAALERERAVITRRAADDEPYFAARFGQKARTCVIEDEAGRVFFLLFDARPAQPGQRGLTLLDLAAYVQEHHQARWAVVCDGGQSARLCGSRASGRRFSFGNRHYLDLTGAAPRWNGASGRAVASAIFGGPA